MTDRPRKYQHHPTAFKRLEAGRFVWPQAENGRVALTSAQLSMLLEGIDWRSPRRTAPTLAA